MESEKLFEYVFKGDVKRVVDLINNSTFLADNMNDSLEKYNEYRQYILKQIEMRYSWAGNFLNIQNVYVYNCIDAKNIFLNTLEQLTTFFSKFAINTNSSLVKEVYEYLLIHYNTNLNLQIVADIFHVNKCYLGRLIKKELNTSFSEILADIRIERACAMFEYNPQVTVNEVSLAVGFNDVYYFSKVFKKRMEIGPREYRRKSDMNRQYIVRFPVSIPSEVRINKKNDVIKIGVIGDFSGNGAYVERCKVPAYKMAAEEINDSGGILGRKIKLIF